MTAGAFGLSTGLFGPPSGYAETDEVVALARVAARHGGGYHTHMRDEGVRIAEAVREALEIGERAGCAVQISHLKISSLDRWGRAPDAARHDRRGPPPRGSGSPATSTRTTPRAAGLRHHLPAWVHAGGLPALLGRLREPGTRARLRYDLVEGMAKAGVSMRFYRWDLTRVSESPTRPDYAGLTLAEIGARAGQAPVDALLDLLLADGGRTGGIYFHIDEGDVRTIMRDPHVGVGSDGLYTGRPGRAGARAPAPAALRHVPAGPRPLRARRGRPRAAGGDPQDDLAVGRRPGPRRPRPDPGGRGGRPRRLRPGDGRGSRHVRGAPRSPRRASRPSSSTACRSSSTASRRAPRRDASSATARAEGVAVAPLNPGSSSRPGRAADAASAAASGPGWRGRAARPSARPSARASAITAGFARTRVERPPSSTTRPLTSTVSAVGPCPSVTSWCAGSMPGPSSTASRCRTTRSARLPGSRLPTSRSRPAARAAPSVAISMASSGAIGWPASAARWTARNGASPTVLWRAESVPRATDAPGGASPGCASAAGAGCPSGGTRAGTRRSTGREARIGSTSPSRITFMWTNVAFGPSTPSAVEVREARRAPARLHRGRHVEVVAEVGVQHDALAVGERLGRAQQLVRRRALAVERDVAVHDAVRIAVPMELAAQELERALARRRHAREQARALEARDHVHQRRIVPEIRIGEGAAHARGVGGGGDRVRLERAPRLDERGVAVAQELETAEGGRGVLVLRPERGLPVGVVRARPAALAAVALEEAAAGVRVDVEVRVDEPRVDDRRRPASSTRGGAPARQHLRLRPDRDDRVAPHRDGAGRCRSSGAASSVRTCAARHDQVAALRAPPSRGGSSTAAVRRSRPAGRCGASARGRPGRPRRRGRGPSGGYA